MQATSSKQKPKEPYKVLCGECPDQQCKAKLYFPAYDSSIECTNCGQRHEKSAIRNVVEVTDPEVALHNMLKNVLLGNVKPKKGPENVKVRGLSNYICKLVSPLLAQYGMDKATGKAKLLTEMGQSAMFDCSVLGDRAFMIEDENTDVMGYGRDRTGSNLYLRGTLDSIEEVNGGEERLIPIHADGDGHCLVHAVSRALVGRELFWYSLRENLLSHIKQNLDKYKMLFQDFVDSDEWEDIISECDPDFVPPYGEPLGLRNIHVFGLANVLKRPIILLDSRTGMQQFGDYSGVFLPGLIPVEQCKGKDGTLHKPLCIAWSSSGRNHYIPLVGIKGKPEPKLPAFMLQRTWGMPISLLQKYMDLDSNGCCVVGGSKCLQDKYILKLVSAMEEVFYEKYRVHPSLVADVHQYMYKTSGIVGVKPDVVVAATQKAVREGRLYRCLTCEALCEYEMAEEWFRKGGNLYNLAVKQHGALQEDKRYSFPLQGVVCSYDKKRDVLVPDSSKSQLTKCLFCQGESVRLVQGNGKIKYVNGDRTTARSSSGRCACGFKHYWDGKEYDNIPEVFPITLEWNGKVIKEKVYWFQYETDVTMNSNVFEVAQALVQKHFPGEFGSERLVQRVVDTILRNTAKRDAAEKVEEGDKDSEKMAESWNAESSSKIILTGHKHKTMHKEELTMSEAEKTVRKQVEKNAPKTQQKKTAELAARGKSDSPKSSPKRLSRTSSGDGQPPHKPASTSSSPSHSTSRPSNEKKIRLSTSDGRQVMLTFTSDVTYQELQELVEKETSVPVSRQRLRSGFPPRELKPKEGETNQATVPLQHGDKVMLEMLPDQSQTTFTKATAVDDMEAETSSGVSSPRHAWSNFDKTTFSQGSEQWLKELKDLPQGGDSIDMSIASLALMAAVAGKDLWAYVQSMPHLFSVGGLFYKQVDRDLGLVDGKHCTLPTLPGKVFRFNSSADRLEICLEPHGHFPVEPGIEKRVLAESSMAASSAAGSSSQSPSSSPSHSRLLTVGGSGVVTHGTEAAHIPFSGQGHSLRSMGDNSARMPLDLPDDFHRGSVARRITSLLNPNSHEDFIQEESDEDTTPMNEDVTKVLSDTVSNSKDKPEEAESVSTSYRKLGPGYCVLNQEATNTSNENVELFRSLAQSIEETFDTSSMETSIEERKEAEKVNSEKVSEKQLTERDESEDTGDKAMDIS